MSALDTRALRDAFGTFLTGVTVVTARDPNAAPIGFTANSFASVSLDPPLVSVCLAKTSSNYTNFLAAPVFAINVLSETQTDVSNTFARPSDDRFAQVAWRVGPKEVPIIEDVSAWFACDVQATVDAGDHVILIGRVTAFDSSAAPGLGYARGAYITPSTATQALETADNLIVSALIADGAQVLLCDDGRGGVSVPQTRVQRGEMPSAALRRLIAATGLKAAPGFIYSVFEDTSVGRQHIAFLCQTEGDTPTEGCFVPLSCGAFDDVSDPAVRTMLERYAAEAGLNRFGIYYGTQDSGEVRTII